MPPWSVRCAHGPGGAATGAARLKCRNEQMVFVLLLIATVLPAAPLEGLVVHVITALGKRKAMVAPEAEESADSTAGAASRARGRTASGAKGGY
eukprot:3329946-Prymnesium_polylepis.1